MLDPKTRGTTNVFDQFGHEVTRRLPMGKTNWMKYDSFGRLSEAHDFKLQKKLIRYDSLGRVATNFWFGNGATYPSNSTEYYYDTLGQLTNITERSGTNASSGYVASVDKHGPRNRYVAAIAKVPTEVAGGVTGVLLFALGILGLVAADVRRRILGALVCAHSANFAKRILTKGNGENRGGLRLILRVLRPSFSLLPSVKSGSLRSVRLLYVPGCFWRYVTYVLVISLIGSDPRFDSVWTARASCISPASNPSTGDTYRVTLFAYDFDGHLTQVNCPEGEINYEYESATGRHTSTCTTNSYVQYGYDELGRLKTVTVLKRNGITLTGTNIETTTYTYTKVGSRYLVTLPNGIVTKYLYDDLNRLTNLTHSIGGNLLASYSYQLHPTGRRTNAVEWLKQEDGAWLTNTLTWSYDQMYRLTNEVSVSSASGGAGTYTHSYQYDQVGNRVKKTRYTSLTETTVSFFNNNDQLTREEITPSSGGASTNYYAYDDNGSVVARTNTSASSSAIALYGFDLKSKLSSVAAYNGSWTTNFFLYNDQGVRVRTSSSLGGSPTLYLIDANNHTGYQQILEELTARGVTASRSYVIGDDVLAQAGSTASYLLYDGHGSTRQLADGTGGVSQRYNYDAYGITQTGTSSSSPSTSLLYCGEQFDSALGMYNLRARFYDPNNGRFNAMDVIRGSNSDPQTLHKYAYCGQDPLNKLDPSGNSFILEFALSTLIRATLAALLIGSIAVISARLRGESWSRALLSGLQAAGLTFFAFLSPLLSVSLLVATPALVALGIYNEDITADSIPEMAAYIAAGIALQFLFKTKAFTVFEVKTALRVKLPQAVNNLKTGSSVDPARNAKWSRAVARSDKAAQGSLLHAELADLMRAENMSRLKIEVSYDAAGDETSYGAAGSVRLDYGVMDGNAEVFKVIDLKPSDIINPSWMSRVAGRLDLTAQDFEALSYEGRL